MARVAVCRCALACRLPLPPIPLSSEDIVLESSSPTLRKIGHTVREALITEFLSDETAELTAVTLNLKMFLMMCLTTR